GAARARPPQEAGDGRAPDLADHPLRARRRHRRGPPRAFPFAARARGVRERPGRLGAAVRGGRAVAKTLTPVPSPATPPDLPGRGAPPHGPPICSPLRRGGLRASFLDVGEGLAPSRVGGNP